MSAIGVRTKKNRMKSITGVVTFLKISPRFIQALLIWLSELGINIASVPNEILKTKAHIRIELFFNKGASDRIKKKVQMIKPNLRLEPTFTELSRM